ncbi:MAG TPA: thiamine-phosphate kinase [Trebonia sp.]|nr:thiamine-phosphate kinase [Trebonia sp.]
MKGPDDPSGSLASVGEFGLIAAMAAKFPPVSLATVGIGDDSAVLATPTGNVVAAVDFLLEGRHFRRDWSAAYDVGVKAAARSLADIAAMGAVPVALLVALALPESLPADWALDFASGLAAECDRAGAGVVGGDTAEAGSVIVSVTALGSLPAGVAAVRRGGARPGDVVAVAGPLGPSAAGLALLAAGLTGHPGLVAAHLRPRPPYAAGLAAARCGATAMIDTSDGLLADLGHVADASGVAIDLARSRLEMDDQLAAAAIDISAVTDPPPVPAALALSWVLAGGEDHSLVATFPAAARLPAGWRVIGTVGAGSGVTVDGAGQAGPGGWQHFR